MNQYSTYSYLFTGFMSSYCPFFLQFVKTILSQGHLTPLPLYVSPVYWAYDYALRVYPVPDVVIFADKYDPFSISNSDCLCINPVFFPSLSKELLKSNGCFFLSWINNNVVVYVIASLELSELWTY